MKEREPLKLLDSFARYIAYERLAKLQLVADYKQNH